MKQRIGIAVIIYLAITSLIQSQSSNHLIFKGVPIDGTLNEYVTKMRQNGYTLIETKNGVAMLKGDFAGYKDCYVGVSTLNQKDLVYKIGVIFPDCETWSTLSGNYFTLKKLLTEKYGEAAEVKEVFDVPSYSQPKDDRARMHEVGFDRCKYFAIWKTDKGQIILSIDHNSVVSSFVTLIYQDKINGEIIKAKAKGDL